MTNSSHALGESRSQRSVWNYHFQLPGKHRHLFYGFWFRLITVITSVIMSTILIMLLGFIVDWQLNSFMIVVYGLCICLMIFLGEYLRVRTYERVILDSEPSHIHVNIQSGKMSIAISSSSEVGNVQIQSKMLPNSRNVSGEARFGILAKRLFDIFVAVFLLVALLPLFVMIAILIKSDDGGPVLFRQKRVGLDKKIIKIYKFRTMNIVENDFSVVQARRNDMRISRPGRILRRLGLDELPQLVNVVKGEMSIVGPRPQTLAQDADYMTLVRYYSDRYRVKPGVIGLAQISGLRGEIHSVQMLEKRVELDLWYIDNWSIGLDAKILLKAIVSSTAHSTY